MCKHILITDFKKDDVLLLNQFAAMTADRDGFGAIIRTRSNEIKTIKSLSLTAFYMKLGELVTLHDISELVVHHRTSTNGTGIEYAHPFEYKGHYLTHNGVITVPQAYNTKTTNDSEQLLHHLIETDFDTGTVKGYFSCFILNANDTTILVDEIAPIYSDGRIYSSHKLDPSWLKIEKQRITLSGNKKLWNEIELCKSTYGHDKAYLSLGSSWYQDDDSSYKENTIDVFLKYMTSSDEYYIANQRTKKEKYRAIKLIADEMRIELTKTQVNEILDCYFYNEGRYA